MVKVESKETDPKEAKSVVDTHALWVVPVILALLAAGYIWVTCGTLGQEAGWLRIINDPGKNLFHVFLLPLAMLLLLKQFPPSGLWGIWTFFFRDKDARPYMLVGVIALLLLVGFVLFGTHLVFIDSKGSDEGESPKIQSPSQFADETFRNALLALDQDLRRMIKLRSTADKPPAGSGGLSPEDAAALYRAAQYGRTPTLPSTLSTDEREALKTVFSTTEDRRKNLIGVTIKSARASYGTLLSVIGAICAIFTALTALAAALVARVRPNIGKDGYDYLYASVVVLILWLGLRPYSEWYNSFYTVMSVDIVFVVMCLAVLACLGCYLLGTKSNALTVAGILGGVSFLSALLGVMGSEEIAGVFEMVADPWEILLGIEFTFLAGVLAIGAWFAIERHEGEAPQISNKPEQPSGESG